MCVQEAILAAAQGEVEAAAGITPADAAEKKRKKKAKRQAAEAEAAAGEPVTQPECAKGWLSARSMPESGSGTYSFAC